MCNERRRRWHHSSGPTSAGRRAPRAARGRRPPRILHTDQPSHLGVARYTGGRPPRGAPSSFVGSSRLA